MYLSISGGGGNRLAADVERWGSGWILHQQHYNSYADVEERPAQYLEFCSGIVV